MADDYTTNGDGDAPQQRTGGMRPTLEDRFMVRRHVPLEQILPGVRIDRSETSGVHAPGDLESLEADSVAPTPSVSIMRKRWRRFKSLKRGYISFIILIALYIISFFLPILVNNKPLVVSYKGELFFPAFVELLPGATAYYPAADFGQSSVVGSVDFRLLDSTFDANGAQGWMIMPPYPWNPLENDFSDPNATHPQAPSSRHILGTDVTGRDVFARLAYGFNISLSFGLILTIITYIVGGTAGGLMGYFGGRFDLYSQRIVEIWANIPFLYTVIIVASIVQPSFMILVLILTAVQWIAISYYMRGEFYREKSKDYVAAAIALGATDRQVIFKHILPNSLTPAIAFFPFAMVGGIGALVGLDFLGFGLQPPTPSWGQMVDIGLSNMEKWWLVVTPLAALFVTLLLITFIGEAIRTAFDPKVFSRLR